MILVTATARQMMPMKRFLINKIFLTYYQKQIDKPKVKKPSRQDSSRHDGSKTIAK